MLPVSSVYLEKHGMLSTGIAMVFPFLSVADDVTSQHGVLSLREYIVAVSSVSHILMRLTESMPLRKRRVPNLSTCWLSAECNCNFGTTS